MATHFVTGGSGFVGGRLIETLVARGETVRALARSDAAAAAVGARGAQAVRGDLDATAALAEGMRGCACVFHAAAHTRGWDRDAAFERITVQGTAQALAAARAAGAPRFVHVGSEAALLDGTPLVRVDETRPLPARPLPGYPASKARSEALVRAANAPGFATVVVRPRLVWGRGDTSLLPQLVQAVRDGRFRWIGEGRHLTSTCHVDNAVEGLLRAAERGAAGGVYFVTDGAPVEFRGFLTALLATQGVQVGTARVPRALAAMTARAGEAAWRLLPLRGEPPLTRLVIALFGAEVTVDDARARRELGYRGAVTIEAGLAQMRAASAS